MIVNVNWVVSFITPVQRSISGALTATHIKTKLLLLNLLSRVTAQKKSVWNFYSDVSDNIYVTVRPSMYKQI